MNTMLRWSPSRQFHFHQDPENMFERFLGSIANDAAQRSSWLPAAEARIEDGTYVLQLALPGVDPKEVSVSLMDNVLTIKGERKAESKKTEAGYERVERVAGTFLRRFTLPETAQADAITAKQANGVLEVSIPKQAQQQPKRIEVQAA